jgi:VanZ family protein
MVHIAVTQVSIFRTLSIAILLGISAACLWPFHAPKNEVTWLTNRRGLRFGRYGTAMSSSPFRIPGSDRNLEWSIELWLQASRPNSRRHFLSFFRPANTALLSLRQYKDGVVVSTEDRKEETHPTLHSLYVGEVFQHPDPVLLSIISGGQQTGVYVDGVLRRSSQSLRLSRGQLSGQLILGDAPLLSDSWSGCVGGLAIYPVQLSAKQVARHFQAWSHDDYAALTGESPAALYLFNEGAGNIVHNQVPAGVDLVIPERYSVAGKMFLEGPLDEYEPTWTYFKSVLINIAGFVPFGFLWYAYLSSSFGLRRTAALISVLLGSTLSLAMEILQGFLPTRNSGVTDIITNTAGTSFGVAMYVFGEGMIRQFLSRVRLVLAGREISVSIGKDVQAFVREDAALHPSSGR